MATDGNLKSLRIMALDGLGIAEKRVLNGREAAVPAGTVVVSADDHWAVGEDIFYNRAPEHLRDKMPRVFWDDDFNNWNIGFGNVPLIDGPFSEVLRSSEARPGAHSISARMSEFDAEGISMSIAFPQVVMAFCHLPDLQVREWIFRIYNEHLAETAAKARGRFFGVGIPNYWDISKSRESIEHIKSLGLKTFMLPISPGKDVSGQPILYTAPEMRPLWDAIEEAGLPVCFHIGENSTTTGPGMAGISAMTNIMPFRKTFSELVFGGIFDRHPRLQVVFAEAGINWVPAALQDAEMVYDSFGELLDPKIAMRPTEYWARHCYATFMTDALGLENIDYIGVDHIMWSSDYPHNEGTMGYTKQIVEGLVARFSESDAKKILGGNAIRVFDLP